MDEENKIQPSVPNNTPAPEQTGYSVVSLILGIVSLIFFCIWYVAFPSAIVAIILGIIGRKKGGKGMGTAGMVLGIISIILAIIIILLLFAGFGILLNNPEFFNMVDSININELN